ncbi:Uncharacterised protein [Mycobacteroides abscessus subsp. abscessus]|nr:Uncharacterised protein [Mycobacteroides abscessus subsp. abscessus]
MYPHFETLKARHKSAVVRGVVCCAGSIASKSWPKIGMRGLFAAGIWSIKCVTVPVAPNVTDNGTRDCPKVWWSKVPGMRISDHYDKRRFE